MSIFFWKKNKLIDQTALILADEFYSQTQPQHVIDYFKGTPPDNKARKKNKQLENTLSKTAGQINAFRKESSLGIYGKARLHMTFVNRLMELGYPEEITRQINEILLLRTP